MIIQCCIFIAKSQHRVWYVPYQKVKKYHWSRYTHKQKLGRLILNIDMNLKKAGVLLKIYQKPGLPQLQQILKYLYYVYYGQRDAGLYFKVKIQRQAQ